MKNLTLLIKPASGSCQYDCEYCFYKDEINLRCEQKPALMGEDTLENLVRRAFADADNQVNLAFQGGEPTLRGIAFFEKLCALQKRYSRGKPYSNSLQTNGGLLDENWAELLKREHFLVGLSLDGDEEAHDLFRKDNQNNGTWRKTVAAAELLKAFDIPFNILTVISKANVNRGREIYEFLKQYRFLQFIPCLDPMTQGAVSYAPDPAEYARFLIETFELYERDLMNGNYVSVRLFDNYIRILAGARPESCAMNGICSVSFTVESDGSVYPCDFYCLDEWKIGNVNAQGFTAMERSETARRFVNSSVKIEPRCRTCKYYYLCRGGCRRERSANDALSLNRYCDSYLEFFNACHDRLLKLKRLAVPGR